MASKSKEAFRCVLCSKNFAEKRYIKAHLQRCISRKEPNSEKSVFTCTECGKIFDRQSKLTRHETTHTEIRNFSCDFCDKTFAQKSHLKRHLETIHRDNQIQSNCDVKAKCCRFCGKSFQENWQVTRHEKSLHQYATNLYKCRYCGDKFDNRKLFINDQEFHKGLRPHKCYICGFSFRRSTELNTHLSALHKQGFVFACVLCNEEFPQRTQLFRHINRKHELNNDLDAENPSSSKEDMGNAKHFDLTENSLIGCRFCRSKFGFKKTYLSHVNDKHYRKLYRHNDLMENIVSEPFSVNEDAGESNATDLAYCQKDNADFVWRSLSLKVLFDENFTPTNVLYLGKLLPEALLYEYSSLYNLEITLPDYTCQPCEVIVIEIPVKVRSSNLDKFPDLLTINYV